MLRATILLGLAVMGCAAHRARAVAVPAAVIPPAWAAPVRPPAPAPAEPLVDGRTGAQFRELAADWVRALRKPGLGPLLARTRLPLTVASSGVCLAGGTPRSPVVTKVTTRRQLARVVAQLRACIPKGAGFINTWATAAASVEWGGESIYEVTFSFDHDGRVISLSDHFSYGGPELAM